MGTALAAQEAEPRERALLPRRSNLQILTRRLTATCGELFFLLYAQAGQNSCFLRADPEGLPTAPSVQALLGGQDHGFRKQ